MYIVILFEKHQFIYSFRLKLEDTEKTVFIRHCLTIMCYNAFALFVLICQNAILLIERTENHLQMRKICKVVHKTHHRKLNCSIILQGAFYGSLSFMFLKIRFSPNNIEKVCKID